MIPPSSHSSFVLVVFCVVYLGMILGGLPRLHLDRTGLLGAVIGVAAALSAVFTNDIVCLAMAPILVDGCLRRRLDPVPSLLALACASNIGSVATLIGNPQNMLIVNAASRSTGPGTHAPVCR